MIKTKLIDCTVCRGSGEFQCFPCTTCMGAGTIEIEIEVEAISPIPPHRDSNYRHDRHDKDFDEDI